MSDKIRAKVTALFFCEMPPPYTGQTIGTELLYKWVSDRTRTLLVNTSTGRINLSETKLERANQIFRWLSLATILRSTLRRYRVSCLYIVVSGSVGGLLRDALCLFVARRRVKRIVAHVRCGDYNRHGRRLVTRLVAKFVTRRIDQFIFLSEKLKDNATHIPENKKQVLYNAIDAGVQCSREEVIKKLHGRTSENNLIVGFVSNMIRSKGYQTVAEAAYILMTQGYDRAQFLFIGEWLSDEDEKMFYKRIREWRIEHLVQVVGPIQDRTEMKRRLLALDILVLPTTYRTEAQPRILIEAMNAGTPIITTRHASIPEYVREGKAGMFVEPGQAGQIANAIISLSDRMRWRQMALMARSDYDAKFDPNLLNGRFGEIIGIK